MSRWLRPGRTALVAMALALLACPALGDRFDAPPCEDVVATVEVVDKCTREVVSSASDVVARRGNQILETVEPDDPESTLVCCSRGTRLRVEPLDKNYYASSWERCRERIRFEIKRKQDPGSREPPKPSEMVEERLKLALRDIERGDPRRAEEELLEAIRIEDRPNCVDGISLGGKFPHYYLPYYHLGRTQFLIGDYANAFDSFALSLERRQVCVCGRELSQLHELRRQCLEKEPSLFRITASPGSDDQAGRLTDRVEAAVAAPEVGPTARSRLEATKE